MAHMGACLLTVRTDVGGPARSHAGQLGSRVTGLNPSAANQPDETTRSTKRRFRPAGHFQILVCGRGTRGGYVYMFTASIKPVGFQGRGTN